MTRGVVLGRRRPWRPGPALIAAIALRSAACGGDEPAAGDDDSADEPCGAGYLDDGGTCVPEACGAGTWGDLPVDDATIRVDGSAADGGDGSADRPFTTLAAAVAAASPGSSIAVAAGAYRENLVLETADLTLAGRCADLVTLDGGGGETGIVVSQVLAGSEVEVSGITVSGSPEGAVRVDRGVLVLHDARLLDNGSVGLWLSGAGTAARLTDVVIADTAVGSLSTGEGIDVWDGAALEARRVRVERSAAAAIWMQGQGTEALLEDVAVAGTDPTGTGWYGEGIGVYSGAVAEIRGCAVDGARTCGVMVVGGEAVLRGTTVAGTEAHPDWGFGGIGLAVGAGAAVDAEDLELRANAEGGVLVSDGGSTLDLRDTRILDSGCGGVGSDGTGLFVGDGGTVLASGVEVDAACEFGAVAAGAGASMELDAVTISGTVAAEDGHAGIGVVAVDGGAVRAVATVIDGATCGGVVASGDGSTIAMEGSAVRATRACADGTGGLGVEAQYGGVLDLVDCVLEDNRDVGVLSSGEGAAVTLQRTEVRGTRRSNGSLIAAGVAVENGASLWAVQTTSAEHEGPGVLSLWDGTLTWEDGAVEGNTFAAAATISGALTIERTTLTSTGADASLGGGVGVCVEDRYGPAAVTLVDDVIAGSELAGLWVVGDNAVWVSGGEIEGGEGWTLATGTVLHGNAVYATGIGPWSGDAGLYLGDLTLRGSTAASILLHGASATLDGIAVDGGAGTDLVWQHCAGWGEPSGLEQLDTVDLCPEHDQLVTDLELWLQLPDIDVAQ